MQAELRQRHGSEVIDSLEEVCSTASERNRAAEETSTSASQKAAFRAGANVPKRHKRAKSIREAGPLHGYSHLPVRRLLYRLVKNTVFVPATTFMLQQDFMRDNEFITAFYRVQATL